MNKFLRGLQIHEPGIFFSDCRIFFAKSGIQAYVIFKKLNKFNKVIENF